MRKPVQIIDKQQKQISRTDQYLTLMQSYKQTPNIFYASSKSKNQLLIFSISINKPRLCRGSESYFISKRLIHLARTKSE